MEWSSGARPELKVLVDQAFQSTDDGSLSASRILGLRNLNIKDTKWSRAMRALNDSVQNDVYKNPICDFMKRGQMGSGNIFPLISRAFRVSKGRNVMYYISRVDPSGHGSWWTPRGWVARRCDARPMSLGRAQIHVARLRRTNTIWEYDVVKVNDG